MPNWSELVREISQLGSPFDVLRRKYILQLSNYTKRNVICYYSGWLQKPELQEAVAVNDTDKNGFMTTINGLDISKGLDLVLHTPGGDTAATESIVDYLWSKFSGDVRCFVPQMAMSAGTMIACASKRILMGKHLPGIGLNQVYEQNSVPQLANVKAALTDLASEAAK